MSHNNYRVIDIKLLLILFLGSLVVVIFSLMGSLEDIRSRFVISAQGLYLSVKTQTENINILGKVFDNFSNINNENKILSEENQKLVSEYAELKIQLDNLGFLVEKGITNFDKDKVLIPVRVLYYDLNQSGEFYINKGKDDNIEANDIAVIGEMLVGYVKESYENHSKITPIITTGTRINVVSLNTKARGIMVENVAGGVMVEQISSNNNLSLGDVFVTEGKDGNFPYGLYVGTVERIIETPAAPTKVAYLSNSLNFRELDRLFITKYK